MGVERMEGPRRYRAPEVPKPRGVVGLPEPTRSCEKRACWRKRAREEEKEEG